MESWLFLLVILAVAFFGKNTSLTVAALVVLALKAIPMSGRLMQVIDARGINCYSGADRNGADYL